MKRHQKEESKTEKRAARPQLPIGPIRLTVTSFPNSFLYLTQPAKASFFSPPISGIKCINRSKFAGPVRATPINMFMTPKFRALPPYTSVIKRRSRVTSHSSRRQHGPNRDTSHARRSFDQISEFLPIDGQNDIISDVSKFRNLMTLSLEKRFLLIQTPSIP